MATFELATAAAAHRLPTSKNVCLAPDMIRPLLNAGVGDIETISMVCEPTCLAGPDVLCMRDVAMPYRSPPGKRVAFGHAADFTPTGREAGAESDLTDFAFPRSPHRG